VPRRFSYALIAVGLAAGAPVGLLAVRSAGMGVFGLARPIETVRGDMSTFVYVTLSTLVAFSAFGYALGRQADMLLELSRTDALTGLRNHRAFEERLVDELARAGRYREPLSLLVFDLDGLKAINDTRGHHAGDVALRALADALRLGARQTDFAARVGGDEFVLLAPRTDAPAAAALGERIRTLVAAQGVQGLTASVGVATVGAGRPTGAFLRELADSALYEAKRRGRNQVACA
jgi:diguanylate cyclase (GGDEF)-like protein